MSWAGIVSGSSKKEPNVNISKNQSNVAPSANPPATKPKATAATVKISIAASRPSASAEMSNKNITHAPTWSEKVAQSSKKSAPIATASKAAPHTSHAKIQIKGDRKTQIDSANSRVSLLDLPKDVLEHHLLPALKTSCRSLANIRVLRKVCRHFRERIPLPFVQLFHAQKLEAPHSVDVVRLCESIKFEMEALPETKEFLDCIQQNKHLRQIQYTAASIDGLVSVLERARHINSVSIFVMDLTPTEASDIVKALQSHPRTPIDKFALEVNFLDDSSALEPILEFCITHKIKELELRNKDLTAKSFQLLVDWIASPDCSLSRLMLLRHTMSTEWAEKLYNAVRANRSLRTLELELSEDTRASMLAAAVQQGHIREFYFGFAFVGDLTPILTALLEPNRRIVLLSPSLLLTDGTQTPEAIELVCKYLTSDFCQTEFSAIEDMATWAISPSVYAALAQNSTLTSLDTAVSMRNVDLIITVLKNSTKLKNFSLYELLVADKRQRGHELVAAIQTNKTLETVDINASGLAGKISWFPKFIAAFASLNTLREFKIVAAPSNAVALSMASVISNNPNISLLDFNMGEITCKGMTAILQAAASLKQLRYLRFRALKPVEKDDAFNKALFATISSCPLESLAFGAMVLDESACHTIIRAIKSRDIFYMTYLGLIDCNISAKARRSFDELEMELDGLLQIDHGK